MVLSLPPAACLLGTQSLEQADRLQTIAVNTSRHLPDIKAAEKTQLHTETLRTLTVASCNSQNEDASTHQKPCKSK